MPRFHRLLTTALLLWAAPAAALTINLDIDPRVEAHVGDDGVLSSPGGTVWNVIGIDFLGDTTVASAVDEFGVATGVGFVFDGAGSFDANARAIELYDGGGTGILEIEGLDPNETYDLAIYTTNASFGVRVTDAGSASDAATGATFAIELPGDEGEEYVLYSGLVPFDLGGGEQGLRIETLNAVRMAGLQLVETPEPSILVLAASAFAFLGWRRQRQPSW